MFSSSKKLQIHLCKDFFHLFIYLLLVLCFIRLHSHVEILGNEQASSATKSFTLLSLFSCLLEKGPSHTLAKLSFQASEKWYHIPRMYPEPSAVGAYVCKCGVCSAMYLLARKGSEQHNYVDDSCKYGKRMVIYLF